MFESIQEKYFLKTVPVLIFPLVQVVSFYGKTIKIYIQNRVRKETDIKYYTFSVESQILKCFKTLEELSGYWHNHHGWANVYDVYWKTASQRRLFKKEFVLIKETYKVNNTSAWVKTL